MFLINQYEFFLSITSGQLSKVPCNVGESQHEPRIEIGKAYEAPKLSECGWGWPVMNDLDIGLIDMHPILIKKVS
jgi:hypothetical protein